LISKTEEKLSLSADLSKLIISFYEIICSFKESEDLDLIQVQQIFEKDIIKGNLLEAFSSLTTEISLLKPMSIELQRSKPSEWNELLDICIQ